jgi:hypothetical protein
MADVDNWKGRGSEAIPALWKKQTDPVRAPAAPRHACLVAGFIAGLAVTSPALTYLSVSANFTDLYQSCRRHWLVRLDRTWSSHGEAHLPPA